MSETVCITFKTHQTIICEVIQHGIGGVIVKNPMQVVPVPPRSTSDSGGVGFAPYLAFVEEFDKGIKFEPSDILTINTPVPDLLAQYTKIFSRIEIAPPGLKL